MNQKKVDARYEVCYEYIYIFNYNMCDFNQINTMPSDHVVLFWSAFWSAFWGTFWSANSSWAAATHIW